MVLLVLCKRDQGSKWKYLKKSEKIHAEKPAFTPDPVSEGEDPSAGNFFFFFILLNIYDMILDF